MILAALVAATLAAQTSACAPIPSLVDEFTAVYGSDPKTQSIDVYMPDGATGEPMIVFVHGGSWVSGDKSQYVDLGRTFAVCGVAFAIVNYALAPTAHADDQAASVALALRFIRDRAGSRSFAIKRIYLMGHSSGAQIAAYLEAGGTHAMTMVGMTQRDLAGVIAIDGAGFDPSIYSRGIALNPVRFLLFSRAFGNDPATWQPFDVSDALDGDEPPNLVMHASDDFIAPASDSADFVAALKAKGDSATYLQFADRDHFSILSGMTDGPGDPALEAVLEFVNP
jgi:arylformamidase